MTNDKTVTMSRELAQKVDDLLYIMTGHDSHDRLVHKYGANWWNPINEMRAEICTLLAAPVVERQPAAIVNRKAVCFLELTETARSLPDGTKLYTSPPAPVAVVRHNMKSVMKAVCAAHNFPMLTSNQCQSLADALNEGLDKVKELNQ